MKPFNKLDFKAFKNEIANKLRANEWLILNCWLLYSNTWNHLCAKKNEF